MWEKKSLGEVCSLIGGGTPTKSNTDYFNGTIPWATVRDMHSDDLNTTEFQITEKAVVESSTNIIPKGNVIIATRVGLGKVCLLHQDTAINQDLRGIIPKDPTILDIRYLFWWLKSMAQTFIEEGTGATVKGIKLRFVTALVIPLPPLDEQKRIVAILDKAFAGIDRAIANTEKNIQNAKELFESYLNNTFTQKGEGWTTEDLSKSVHFIDYRGKTPPKVDYGVRLITAKNVKMGYVQNHPEEFIDADVYDDWMTRGYPVEGDVLFTTEAPLGNVAQLGAYDRVVVGQRLITMQPEIGLIDKRFLKYRLMSPETQSEIHSKATGATVLGIKSKLLKRIPISYPPLVIQRRMADLLDEATDNRDALIGNYHGKLTALKELKQSLLQKAFAGELTAGDAELGTDSQEVA